ncbi:MAG: hypothetical protein DRH08_09920 [Deltaproteobacteria bacterium]|nr:MAG: hypothetical protein DRH08_09920 [Deltaproteobacteria bacterium]
MPNFFSNFPVGLQLWPQAWRRSRNLQEGYNFSLLENSSDTYHFSVLADASRTRDAFNKFAASMPEEAFFILEFYTTEPNINDQETPTPAIHYSPYMPIPEIIAAIEPYWDRMMHDGFVGFGLANNRSSQEMFYSEEKVLTFFTDNHLRLTNQLAKVGLPHRPDLLLHTELGHDHLSLLCLERENLPNCLQDFSDRDLDYAYFCRELVDSLGMYPVEESLSFFFSRKEQELIEEILCQHPSYEEFAEDDFGALLLDWNDFVQECCNNFEGDLWEYRMGLQLRDMLYHVISICEEPLKSRILEVLKEPDEKFRQILIDNRKRLDNPGIKTTEEHFWYNGVISNAGHELRRDLIRHGWYKP